MAARISAAIVGGLVLSVAAMLVLALYLPIPAGDRLIYAGLAQPLVWAAAMAYGFLARNGLRAWLGFLGLSALCTAAIAIQWVS